MKSKILLQLAVTHYCCYVQPATICRYFDCYKSSATSFTNRLNSYRVGSAYRYLFRTLAFSHPKSTDHLIFGTEKLAYVVNNYFFYFFLVFNFFRFQDTYWSLFRVSRCVSMCAKQHGCTHNKKQIKTCSRCAISTLCRCASSRAPSRNH